MQDGLNIDKSFCKETVRLIVGQSCKSRTAHHHNTGITKEGPKIESSPKASLFKEQKNPIVITQTIRQEIKDTYTKLSVNPNPLLRWNPQESTLCSSALRQVKVYNTGAPLVTWVTVSPGYLESSSPESSNSIVEITIILLSCFASISVVLWQWFKAISELNFVVNICKIFGFGKVDWLMQRCDDGLKSPDLLQGLPIDALTR
ncbi:hypothetical protein RRG08_029370 [Elysia crispata]|uniref:Uncharacterized protein n=1 Tax=Elysia crispata TaxID=231223 RepID=A0AAE1B7M9_9GAST|nr:hypothetical protein RRG08_029370 [Elysia crispata]